MEYFLYIEDDDYHAWQAELLIESFQKNDIEDQLLICSTGYNSTKSFSVFTQNLMMHERKAISSLMFQKECPELNRLYGLIVSMGSGQLQQPFWLIEPDCVLVSDSRLESKLSNEDMSFKFSVDPLFTVEEAEHRVGNFVSWYGIDRENLKKVWMPLGGFQLFNRFPIDFFLKLLDSAEDLAVRQIVEGRKVWEKTYELALFLTLARSNASMKGDHSIVSSMALGDKTSFISYKYGQPPTFHKSMFKFEPSSGLSFGDPIEILSKVSSSPNAHYVSSIARRSIEKR